MHPYVYKKQHKPLRAVLRVFIFIMILCPVNPVNSCNFAVKEVQIFSDFSKGHIRIESTGGHKVIARKCNENCPNDMYYFYTVTIDKHYMLLYHIKTSMFICWNKHFTKLVARLNPTNLTYCKFEEKPSITKNGSHVRYTTVNHEGKEVEIRFSKMGAFSTPRRLARCLKAKHAFSATTPAFNYSKLNLATIKESREDMRKYKILTSRCAGPNFLPKWSKCESRLPEFCAQMKILKDKGHNITFELTDLCKNEWNRRN